MPVSRQTVPHQPVSRQPVSLQHHAAVSGQVKILRVCKKSVSRKY